MDKIINNPYRILGIYANASLREMTSNKTKLARYASVGKSVSFDADLNSILPPAERTEASVEKAFSDLSLPQHKLKHALFWFVKDTPADEMAFDHLKTGDYDDANELFEESDSWSGLVNVSTLSLIKNDFGKAIECITQVIHVSSYRNAMVSAICGNTFQIEESDLAKLYVDSLAAIKPMNDLYRLFMSYDSAASDSEYLKTCMIAEPVEKLNNEINKAKTVQEDGVAIYEAGVTLQQNTKLLLEQLKGLLGAENVEYKLNVEKCAKTVLQCCIDSFKALQKEVEDDKEERFKRYAPKVKELLASINTSLVSDVTKERIETNLKTVSEIVDDLDGYVLLNSQICYFCGKNKADPSAQIKKKMYLETGRMPTVLNRIQVSYKQCEIGIDRCKHCKEIHEKDHKDYLDYMQEKSDVDKKARKIFVVSLIICFVLIGVALESILIGFLLCWIPGLLISNGVEKVLDMVVDNKRKKSQELREKLQIKTQWNVYNHPVVKRMMSEGWADHEPII